VTELNRRLGFADDDRVVIINCDDLGMSQSTNEAVYGSLREGAATSATLMVPCPWSRHAAVEYRGDDVGVHLTLNAEWDSYRWGPITHAPSLLDGDGGFPRTVTDVWDHADLDEVRRECRAQIERAVLWGFDVSHLDSHMGTLQLRPEFFDVYLDLAVEFGLPLRMPGEAVQELVGFPFRDLAEAEGVVFPDHFVYVGGVGSRTAIGAALADLRQGVTEIYLHPAADSPELRAIGPDVDARIDDYELLTDTAQLAADLDAAQVKTIGFRPLQLLMRAG
jgi:predicted glycoside hydrolase/deacetylase ChbG (UPF0249 family)